MEQNQPEFHRALDISVSLIAVNESYLTVLFSWSNCGAHSGKQADCRTLPEPVPKHSLRILL